ncbi:hypothetical protein V2W45_1524845 [Cenococcum geophilum]
MAPLALPFEPSYTTLKSLQVKEGVERVNIKVEEVKAEVDEVDKKVDEVDKKVDKVDKKVNKVNKKIKPITAYVQDGDYYRYIRLVLDPKTLTDLERWKRATLRDTNVSCYMELEDAVTAYPYKCLRALAIIWGLQYSRKVETDNGLRQDNDSVIGSESTSSQNPSRVISVQIQVPSNTERRDLIKLLIVAKREDLGRHSPKIRSTSSTKRRRNRMRHSDSRSDRTPREELRQLVSSPEPTQPFSSKELRQLAPGLGPT